MIPTASGGDGARPDAPHGRAASLAAGDLRLEPGLDLPDDRVVATTRIGVAYAGDWATLPWRLVLVGDPAVSVPPGRG